MYFPIISITHVIYIDVNCINFCWYDKKAKILYFLHIALNLDSTANSLLRQPYKYLQCVGILFLIEGL